MFTLARIHDVFHVYVLKKFHADDTVVAMPRFPTELEFEEKLHSDEGNTDTTPKVPTINKIGRFHKVLILVKL